jgi:hypothetical protein
MEIGGMVIHRVEESILAAASNSFLFRQGHELGADPPAAGIAADGHDRDLQPGQLRLGDQSTQGVFVGIEGDHIQRSTLPGGKIADREELRVFPAIVNAEFAIDAFLQRFVKHIDDGKGSRHRLFPKQEIFFVFLRVFVPSW